MFETMFGIAEDACGRAFDAITSPGERLGDDRLVNSMNRIGDTLHDMNMRSLVNTASQGPRTNWKAVWDNLTHKNG